MATIIVNTTLDELDGSIVDDDVSLRDAIAAANATAGTDTIAFDAGVFNGEAADILRLTQGQIAITDALTIDGGAVVTITGDAGGDDVTLAGGITDVDASLTGENRLDDNSRIFDATAALTLDGLTLTGGRTTGDLEHGGALRTATALTLIDSSVSGNSTGGLYAHGGGIDAQGSVTVTNSTISGNSTSVPGFLSSDPSGGGIYALGSVTVTNSTITDNYGYGGGGGIRGREVDVTNSSFSGNFGYLGGGGIKGTDVTVIDSTFSDNNGGHLYGGGIDASVVTVTNSTFSGNSASGFYGAGGAMNGGTVTVTNSTISDNSTYREGGGIRGFDVTVTNSTVSGNSAGTGGGIDGAYVTVTNSTISGNSAGGGGGLNGNTVTLINSILLGNADPIGVSDVVTDTLVRTGGNIIGGDVFSGDTDVGDTSAATVFAATTEIAPGVVAGVLADNGGPTQTIALRLAQDNPAIGGADPATATAADQRGVPRDADPDLGAFEAGPIGPPGPFRVEAETLALLSGFRVERAAAASGDMVIKSPNPKVEAHARFTFAEQDGVYELDLGYFDETDGKSRLSVFVDGVEVDSFRFKEKLGSACPNSATQVERHIDGLEIETGDVIELVGRSNRDEPLRIDYLDFTFVDDLIT